MNCSIESVPFFIKKNLIFASDPWIWKCFDKIQSKTFWGQNIQKNILIFPPWINIIGPNMRRIETFFYPIDILLSSAYKIDCLFGPNRLIKSCAGKCRSIVLSKSGFKSIFPAQFSNFRTIVKNGNWQWFLLRIPHDKEFH